MAGRISPVPEVIIPSSTQKARVSQVAVEVLIGPPSGFVPGLYIPERKWFHVSA